MAKNMARIENGVVVNIEWFSDAEMENEFLKDAGDIHVEVGDTYSNGRFYRDGILLLSPFEELQSQFSELDNAYEEGVNSV